MKTTEMAFSCGSDFIDWHCYNCRHCTKSMPAFANKFTREIEKELVMQFVIGAPISEKTLEAAKKRLPRTKLYGGGKRMNTILFILILLLICAALILANNFGYDKGYHDGYEDGDYEGYRCGLIDSSKQIEKFCDKITKKKTAASE